MKDIIKGITVKDMSKSKQGHSIEGYMRGHGMIPAQVMTHEASDM